MYIYINMVTYINYIHGSLALRNKEKWISFCRTDSEPETSIKPEGMTRSFDVPDGCVLWVHKKLRTGHLTFKGYDNTFVCGRSLSDAYELSGRIGEFDAPRCRQCFNSKLIWTWQRRPSCAEKNFPESCVSSCFWHSWVFEWCTIWLLTVKGFWKGRHVSPCGSSLSQTYGVSGFECSLCVALWGHRPIRCTEEFVFRQWLEDVSAACLRNRNTSAALHWWWVQDVQQCVERWNRSVGCCTITI